MGNDVNAIGELIYVEKVWNEDWERLDAFYRGFDQLLKVITSNGKKQIYTPLDQLWPKMYYMADVEYEYYNYHFVDDIKAAKKILNYYEKNFSGNYDFIQGFLSVNGEPKLNQETGAIYFDGFSNKLRGNFLQYKENGTHSIDTGSIDTYAIFIGAVLLPRYVFYSAIKKACPTSVYSTNNSSIVLKQLNLLANRSIDDLYNFDRFSNDFDYLVDLFKDRFNLILDEKVLTLIACEYSSPFGHEDRLLNKLFYAEHDPALNNWYKENNRFKLPIEGMDIYTTISKYLEYFD